MNTLGKRNLQILRNMDTIKHVEMKGKNLKNITQENWKTTCNQTIAEISLKGITI